MFPALEKSASHLPASWTCSAWGPGVSPLRSNFRSTPAGASVNLMVPASLPFANFNTAVAVSPAAHAGPQAGTTRRTAASVRRLTFMRGLHTACPRAFSFRGDGCGRRTEGRRSTGEDKPRIKVKDNPLGVVATRRLQRQRRAILIFDADEANAQRANVLPTWNFSFFENLRPRIDRIACERRGDVPAAVDGGQMEGVAEAIVGQRPHQRDDDTAVDDALAEASLRFGVLIEVHFGRVLVEARRRLMLGFFQGHAVDVVDFFARLVVAPAMRRAREREIVFADIERGDCQRQVLWLNAVGKLRHDGLGRRGSLVALAHHHPAAIFEDDQAVLVAAGRADINRASFAVRIFLEANDLGNRTQRVARIDGLQKPAGGVAEV